MLKPKTGRRGRFPALAVSLCLVAAGVVQAASVEWFVNAPNDYDHGRQLVLPPGFGAGEFTFELWIRPNDSFPVGSTADGTAGQRTNWSNADNTPSSSSDWWFQGNFLLDGHNNQNSNFEAGTFSLQFYGSGRVRWLFGDGPAGLPGGVRAVGAPASTQPDTLLDGQWHQITLVRRFPGSSGASLEIWIDGALRDTTASDRRTDMAATYWNNWTGFPANQRGWFWAAEKQAAINTRSQYEDYKGRIDEMRFWSRAKTAMEISTGFANPVTGTEPGLVGRYGFDEGTGTSVCDSLEPTRCITLVNPKTGFWSTDNAPLSGGGGDTTAPTVPGNLRTTNVAATSVTLAWDASTDNVGVSSYSISRNGTPIGSSATTSFVDNTVAANTSYSYEVRARDAAGNVSQPAGPLAVTTPAAPPDTTAPTVPGNLRTTSVAAASVTLAWNASTDNVGVTSYRVLRGGVEIGSSVTTSFVDNTVGPNTSYSYTVQARDAAGNVSGSAGPLAVTTPSPPSDTTPPTVPGNLRTTSVTAASVTLAWNASTDNVGVISYRVFRGGVQIGTSITTSFVDPTVAANTSYSYTVRARDAAGNSSQASSPLAVTTPAPASDSTPPTIPASLRTTAVTSTSVTLAWNASTDNVAVTSYRISRDGDEIGSSTTPTFADATVAANTAYSYTVEARDAAGNTSLASASLAVTTPATPPPPPPPPPPNQPSGGGGGALDGILLLALLGGVLRLFVTHVARRRPPSLYTRL